ncbi:VWA domain-containing protein, partial [Candidatus Ozemobacteraceae bacterium]|nr:VWA domain-containing protein [Candidatus Ozemobacteraceae bacterium]
MKLVYLENGAEVRKELSGESWTLSFAARKGDVLPFLKEYARKIGAEIFSTGFDDGFIFRVIKDGSAWWCGVNAKTWNRVDLSVLRQKILPLNEKLKITKDMYGRDGGFRFLVDVPGRRFLLVRCSVSNGSIRLRANNDISNRDGMILIRYMKYLNSANYVESTLYDFPQDPGLYEFSLDRMGNQLPDEVTLELIETQHELPGYKSGGMGTLVVKNVPAGKVYVTPQSFVDIRQGNKNLAGGVTRDGGAACGTDVTFRLPAGYYTVVSELSRDFLEAKTQLVPVSAGERTTVRLPESWSIANRALLASGDDRELTGEITINEKKDLVQTAEVAVSVSDPKERDVFPTKENTVITESGAKTEILEIRREIAPCSIALAIDSSGSMKKDMKATLEAAKTFLQSLPESSFVQIIDFDGKVRELKGTTAKEAVKNLSSIKAEGSTKLYDATVRGVELVTGKPRPAVVVFTDGVDSREDKRGSGSTNTREQAVKKVLEAKIPVYTIGFGKRLNADQTLASVDGAPDIGCLTEFAATSNGQYYPAKDPEALRGVFAAIGSRLGNNFVITYRRPTENNVGITPVVSMVIDNSGSMNSDPKTSKDGDFRMEKTKGLLRDFVVQLPDAAVMQFTTFQGGGAMRVDVNRRQVSTTNKANIVKAIGEMNPVDGTPIVEALTSAFENIVPIPSQKKVIVFHTDSGLELQPSQVPEYRKILARIKDKGIFVLWIGMGISTPEKEKVFAEAAEATNGEYVISESADEIGKKLTALLERLQQPSAATFVPLTVEISYRTAQGETLTYKAQDQAEFSPPAKMGTPREPDVVAVETGGKVSRQEDATANNAGGGVPASIDNVVCAVSEIGKTMSNKAMEMTVKRAAYLEKIMGLDARRSGFQFVAFDLELKNRTEKNIPYEIPSIFKHFYLGLDGKGLYPASKATWLVEKPVTRHGVPSISIPAGSAVAGTLVFLVPARNEGFTIQSLHFYDTEYGHIQMPISGEMPHRWLDLAQLPTNKPTSLSDGFSLEVTATGLETAIDRYKAGECARFRVIEAEFRSQVQALLN